jgi:hypothetical protein
MEESKAAPNGFPRELLYFNCRFIETDLQLYFHLAIFVAASFVAASFVAASFVAASFVAASFVACVTVESPLSSNRRGDEVASVAAGEDDGLLRFTPIVLNSPFE